MSESRIEKDMYVILIFALWVFIMGFIMGYAIK